MTEEHLLNFDLKALEIQFTKPLHTIDEKSFIHFILQLADTNLIHGHRVSEWCGHSPELEQDIALSNIALDLIGQARILYQYASFLNNESGSTFFKKPSSEDSLAYLRTDIEYKNILMAELPKGDWSYTILKLYFITAYNEIIYTHISEQNIDSHLKIMAQKFLKEITYHLKWTSEWVKRLSQGTKISNEKINITLKNLWDYTGEFFMFVTHEKLMLENGLLPTEDFIKNEWMHQINNLFENAELKMPEKLGLQNGGKKGNHTEHLGFILAEMQYLQRTYPNCNW